jgi:branched-chain amino acid transport system substrate-binding protein
MCVGVGLLAAACSSSSKSSTNSGGSGSSSGSSGAGSGLPSSIHLYSLQDLTGAAGKVGVEDENGYNLAIDQINSSHMLGNTTLTISYGDSATSPATAANVANQAVTGGYPVIFGSPSSGTAVAEAPILSRSNQVTIFTQAGSNGVLVGPSIYRMTPLQTTLFPLEMKWLQNQNHPKTIAALTDSDFPTQVAEQDELQKIAGNYGMTVSGTEEVLATQSNISSSVSKLVGEHPDAIALFVTLGQNATAATDLAQDGFKGPIIAEEGAGNGALSAAGSAANGIVWATDWAPPGSGSLSTNFASAYQARYGHAASDWAAESYDAMMYVAKAFAKAKSTDTTKLEAALNSIGSAGFDGVLGHITVTQNQELSSGYLVQWENGNTTLLPTPSS